MRRFLKLVLLYSIVLAVPVQGIAAATMTLCGPIHQRMAEAGQLHVHGAHADHGVHHHVSSRADVSGHPDMVEHTTEHPVEKYSCSACAACCMNVAISGPFYQAPAVIAAVHVLVPSIQTGFSGFIPERPEHPPRLVLV